MPITDLAPPALDAPIGAPPEPTVITPGALDLSHGSDSPVERPAWSETMAAAWRSDNTVGSYFANEARNTASYREPGFDRWNAIKGTKYEAHVDSFLNSWNPRSHDAIKRQIDREEADNKTLDAAPWYQSVPTRLIAGVFDVPSLIPGGAFVRAAGGGVAMVRSTAKIAALAGVSAAAQEAALQATQETRSASDTAVTIGSSVFLGGILGVAGSKLLSHAEWTHGVEALNKDFMGAAKQVEGAIPVPEVGMPGAGGAAANAAPSLDQNSVAGAIAGKVAKASEPLNPLTRNMQSPSAEARDVGQNLFENSLYLKKNMEGIASDPAAETLMKEWNGGLMTALQSTNDGYKLHSKAGGQMSREDFSKEVSYAMRRNDTHADPFVDKVAKDWRANVFDPLKDKAIEAGLLPKDVSVDTALSYLSRMWNRNKLIAREGEFKSIVQNWVSDNAPKWAADFDSKAESRVDPLRREIADLEQSKSMREGERNIRDHAEISPDGMSEGEVIRAMRMVDGGIPKPKNVETLTQFIHRNGGLVDTGGDLASRGITNKSRPGFIRTTRAKDSAPNGGMGVDDAARHAWESGYFPHLTERPSIDEFMGALEDDFFKLRAVTKDGDQEAYRLHDAMRSVQEELNRMGVKPGSPVRFATSEEGKGLAARVHAALDAQANERIGALRKKIDELDYATRTERDARFLGDHKELGRGIADEVFNKLTGKAGDGTRPEFITVNARGPLKERTFNIPDHLIEHFLENDIDLIGRRYTRTMGADIELTNKFGSPDMKDAIQRIRDDYAKLRAGVADEKQLLVLGKREKDDIADISDLRDQLRGTKNQANDTNYARVVSVANSFNYLTSMGEVVLASLTDVVRPAMVHGLMPFMGTVGQLVTNMRGIKMAVHEGQLAGNIGENLLAHRLGTITDLTDPYSARGPIESFMGKMTEVGSKWNGIRLWTDWMKSLASVMTQNRILESAGAFGSIKPSEKAYLAYLGVNESMAGRIAKQYETHGRMVQGVRVAGTEQWTDQVAVRAYRAAMNKDVDSIIVQKGVADVPLFSSTPTGRMLLQFQSFGLASHQKVLLRGLQEGHARFLGGTIAMTMIGMAITYLKAISGNRPEVQDKIMSQPGWWVSEGLDRSGILSVPMQMSNMFEKAAGVNPIKAPFTAFDDKGAISQKNQNRSLVGALAGPTAGLIDNVGTAMGIPNALYKGEDITKGQKSAAERILPFNSYLGVRQIARYIVNPPTP